jgi:hypothetical protein
MNKLVLLFALILSVSFSALGAPMCMSNTLGGYLSLGAAGCEIGGANFSGFATLPPITGAQAIPSGNIMISPVQTGAMVGLDVQISATASSGQLLEALLGYTVKGGSIVADMVSVSGTSATGGAIVTDIQNYCAGGSFLPGDVTGCTGSPGDLVVLNNGTDQASLAGVSTVNIVHDFTLDAGAGGTASGGMVSDRFTLAGTGPAPVPEPTTYVLMSTALIALAIRSRMLRQVRIGNLSGRSK